MNEKAEFYQEMFFKALMNKVNENTDILNLLLQSADDTENGLRQIKKGIDEVKDNTEWITIKIDEILGKLNTLEGALADLKSESREVEQKLFLMSRKLEDIEESVSEDEIEDYYVLCQSLYNNWDELDDLTRKLIPVAEYLFSMLQKYDKPDYSPVILELCRALENEFLLKIFRKYTLDVIERKGNALDTFLVIDKSSGYLKSKTGIFVKAITKSVRTKRPEYTLGQMNTIMSFANNEATVSQSPLLQDFRNYLTQETVINHLLSIQYIRKINDLVEQYRNPSAHPGYMPLEKAQECKDIMPDRIDYLMECLAK